MERRHLSLDESNRTIGILEFGMSQADVVNTFNQWRLVPSSCG
jgi:hypothetical protein